MTTTTDITPAAKYTLRDYESTVPVAENTSAANALYWLESQGSNIAEVGRELAEVVALPGLKIRCGGLTVEVA